MVYCAILFGRAGQSPGFQDWRRRHADREGQKIRWRIATEEKVQRVRSEEGRDGQTFENKSESASKEGCCESCAFQKTRSREGRESETGELIQDSSPQAGRSPLRSPEAGAQGSVGNEIGREEGVVSRTEGREASPKGGEGRRLQTVEGSQAGGSEDIRSLGGTQRARLKACEACEIGCEDFESFESCCPLSQAGETGEIAGEEDASPCCSAPRKEDGAGRNGGSTGSATYR